MKLLPILVAALFAGAVLAQATAAPAAAAVKSPYIYQASYPLTTCVVSGEELDADAVTFEAGGHTFKTCCNKCKAKVEKDPAAFAPKLEAAIIASQQANYPLETCPVSGEKLGGMGEPVQLVLDGTLVKLCCKNCVKKANTNAAAIVAKIRDAAYAAQNAKYSRKTCIVTGEELGADADAKPVDLMVDNTLLKLCCKGCVKKVMKDPAMYIAKLAGKVDAKDEPCDDDKKAEGKKAEGKKAGTVAMAVPVQGAGAAAAEGAASCCGDDAPAKATGTGGCCCGNGAAPVAVPVDGKPEAGAAGGCCDAGAAAKPAPKARKPQPKF